MIRSIILFFTAFLIQFTIVSQTINNEKSVVNFDISNMAVNTVEGTFTGFSGNILFNPSELEQSKIDICINAASVDTGNDDRDEHLRTADFFDVEKYPEICFVSYEITKHPKGYIAKGNLKIHGVTKTVQIPLMYKDNTLFGKLTIDRFDYKIGEDTNTFMVGSEVDIVILCVLKP
jgi:polyisoprenoid-binding protein YceI